ncbi:non-hydrolyzing UDP-N-acetylglucosamine 2-epimerase [Thalassospira tepidiphila]|uniref:non-hydrolyzing UDP-N-acetylglucosamine 2-epimerase n=1 Tax=Thalassospira tepidiphila TaxID=393657 RepID=UPI0030C685A0
MIKLAPVIRSLNASIAHAEVIVYSTGQHRELLDQTLGSLSIEINFNFDLMMNGQSPSQIHCKVVSCLEAEFKANRPDLIVVQGDTVSAFAGAVAGYLSNVPVAHVEAGLRSHNLSKPWPEEGLRQMIARVATLHFAPTEQARANLLAEGIDPNQIYVVGNPGIDSLELVIKNNNPDSVICGLENIGSRKLVIITMHRREAFAGGMDKFCQELLRAVNKRPDIIFVWPIHPNPKVREILDRHFFEVATENLMFVSPLAYDQMISLLSKADLVISDSGGMQEEAPYCGVPILVTRDETERPEIIDLGLGLLIGSSAEGLQEKIDHYLATPPAPASIDEWRNIQGNGQSAAKISAQIKRFVTE